MATAQAGGQTTRNCGLKMRFVTRKTTGPSTATATPLRIAIAASTSMPATRRSWTAVDVPFAQPGTSAAWG
jgi:hypothetical protein